jgi:hypothetical protein
MHNVSRDYRSMADFPAEIHTAGRDLQKNTQRGVLWID